MQHISNIFLCMHTCTNMYRRISRSIQLKLANHFLCPFDCSSLQVNSTSNDANSIQVLLYNYSTQTINFGPISNNGNYMYIQKQGNIGKLCKNCGMWHVTYTVTSIINTLHYKTTWSHTGSGINVFCDNQNTLRQVHKIHWT